MEYPHINSVFKREEKGRDNPFVEGLWSNPEFFYLAGNEWLGFEKVDGMNIRVYLNEGNLIYKGRTDKARLPTELLDRLNELFLPNLDRIKERFPSGTCFYGEGYGGKIQNGGKYKAKSDFVLFDIRIGNLWVKRIDLEGISNSLKLDLVPLIIRNDLFSMISEVRTGFLSSWSNGKNEFLAEGLICIPSCPLKSRFGNRIITKIKHKDFNLKCRV